MSLSSELTSSSSRLIRSLRRFDRKLLPLIDKWTVVVVAITRLKNAYFDAVGVDNDNDLQHSKDTIVAGKGGKACYWSIYSFLILSRFMLRVTFQAHALHRTMKVPMSKSNKLSCGNLHRLAIMISIDQVTGRI